MIKTFPVLATILWSSLLLTLGIIWFANGSPSFNNSLFPTISQLGADYLYIFIPLTSVFALFFTLSLIEFVRYCSVNGQTSALQVSTLLMGVFSGGFLILLAVFDTDNYSTAHTVFSSLFFLFLLITLLLNYKALRLYWNFRLVNAHPLVGIQASRYTKLIFLIIAVPIGITMIFLSAICNYPDSTGQACYDGNSVGAFFEWTIAIMFSFYISTWVIDYRNIEEYNSLLNNRQDQGAAASSNSNGLRRNVIENNEA